MIICQLQKGNLGKKEREELQLGRIVGCIFAEKTFKMCIKLAGFGKNRLLKHCWQKFVRNRKIVGNNFYTRLCLLAMVCCSEYVLRRVSVVQLTKNSRYESKIVRRNGELAETGCVVRLVT